MEHTLNIVLVEPEIPQNTGNIARTCAATGCALHLIEPLGFEITDRNLKRAGLDYWDKLEITRYGNLDEFFEKNEGEYWYFSSKGTKKYTEAEYTGKTYLFFGRETKGLPEELLKKNLDRALRIPMLDDIRCLNLSNSAAIAAYEVLRQWDFKGFKIQSKLSGSLD